MKVTTIKTPYAEAYEKLRQRKKELQERIKEAGKDEGQGVVLELSAVDGELEDVRAQMDEYMQLQLLKQNMQAAKKQGEAAKKQTDDMTKCMETARRIANGDKVPAKDEQKLMEYSFELYSAAKNMASMKKNSKPKEYDSLWEEEDGKEQCGQENGDSEEGMSPAGEVSEGM